MEDFWVISYVISFALLMSWLFHISQIGLLFGAGLFAISGSIVIGFGLIGQRMKARQDRIDIFITTIADEIKKRKHKEEWPN